MATKARPLALALCLCLATSCASTLRVDQLQTEYTDLAKDLDRVILDGSRSRDCAPKATALAETNLEFARTELEDDKYARAREHLDIARNWIEEARANTNPDCAAN